MLAFLTLLTSSAFSGVCGDNLTLTEASTGGNREVLDRFGNAVATGDFDGDGLDDLVVATSLEDWSGQADAGSLTVHYGTTGVLGSSFDRWTQLDVTGADHASGDQFGSVLAVGDFNDDGYDDLAVGNPFEDHLGFSSTGQVAVKYGSSMGLSATSSSNSWRQGDVAGVGDSSFSYFGDSLAVGDFDGDGVDDLAVSSSFSAVGGYAAAGRVVIMSGLAIRGLDGGDSESFNRSHFGATWLGGDLFGSALAAGDFDGDGIADLAIGASGYDSLEPDGGQVLIKFGSTAGLKASSKSMVFSQQTLNMGIENDDHFGSHLTVGNSDGDAFDDLFMGIPRKTVNGVEQAGIVGVMRGATTTSAMYANGSHLRSVDANGTEVRNDYFGEAMAVGDLNGDGFDEVLIGAPGAKNEGRIAVFMGSSSGPDKDDWRYFGEACVGGVNDWQGDFGSAITIGDYGNGPQMVFGDPTHTPNQLGAVFVSTLQ